MHRILSVQRGTKPDTFLYSESSNGNTKLPQVMKGMLMQQLYILFKIQIAKKWIARYLKIIFFEDGKEETDLFFELLYGLLYGRIFDGSGNFGHQWIRSVLPERFFAHHKIPYALKVFGGRNDLRMKCPSRCNPCVICKMLKHLLQGHLAP